MLVSPVEQQEQEVMIAHFVFAARPRPSQSHSCGGGDLPGILRLGAADHAHVDCK